MALDFLTGYARKNDPDELVIPDDLTELDADELTELSEKANDAFMQLYGDGDQVSADDLAQMEALAAGIDKIRAEQNRRESEQAERSDAAAKIAARINPPAEEEDGEDQDADKADKDAGAEDCEDCDEDDEADGEEGKNGEVKTGADVEKVLEAIESGEETPEQIAASAKQNGKQNGRQEKKDKSIRVSLSGLRSRQPRNPIPVTGRFETMGDIVTAAPDLPGYANGEGMTWEDLGRGVDRRLTGYQHTQYLNAHNSGHQLRQQYGVAVFRKPFTPDLVLDSDDPGRVDEVFQHAMNEHRLPGGSLVAAGQQGSSGWCAPSETLYDLCELESRDGLLTLPEVAVRRGGLKWTTGPDYASIFADTGFCYTEQDVIEGNYDGEGGGTKPCFYVPCPEFVEKRLDLCGTCISAGLLMSRGYPEVIARTIRGALVAHAHRMSGIQTRIMAEESTPVTMGTDAVGTAAPLLSAIELQVEHMRYLHRMSRGTTMEAIFPFWVRGVIRADLSYRLGMAMLDVTDAQIDAWFRSRGIAPQFVYNWQGLEAVEPDAATAWPQAVTFLLYPAGTFVRGSSDIITLDTLYDSTLLGTNDFIALFTEEGYQVFKLCHDSRVVTVPICPDGATGAGVEVPCEGIDVNGTNFGYDHSDGGQHVSTADAAA